MSQLSISSTLDSEISRDQLDAKFCSLKFKRWLRTDEVALYLGTTQGAIRNLVLRGKLKPTKCFGRNFFDKDFIDRLLGASTWETSPRQIRRK